MAEVKGKFGLFAKMKFGWFVGTKVLGSYLPISGDLSGVDNLFSEKKRLVSRAMKRQRVLGRKLLLAIAKYQKEFMDQSFLLGDEGGVFDQLSHSMASMCFALSLEKASPEYLKVGAALDLEATLRMSGRETSPALQTAWAEIGQLMMNRDSQLHKDLIGDMEVADIPLDPRFIDRFI